MSWSNNWLGRRSGIKAAMARYSAGLTGPSKQEFDEARPHLEALVDLNFNVAGDPVVQLTASGHAYRPEDIGARPYSQVSVTLTTIGVLAEEPAAPPDAEASSR